MPFKRTAEDTLFGARMDIFFLFSGKNGVPRGGLECIYLAGCDLDINLSSRRRYLRKEKTVIKKSNSKS